MLKACSPNAAKEDCIMEEIKDFVICLFDMGLQLVPKSWFVPNSLENVMFPLYKTESRIMKAVRNKETPQDSPLWDIHRVLRVMGSDDNFDKAWKKLLKARYMSDISSEESGIERAKRKEHAKKLTDSDFTSDGEGEIPLPHKWKSCITYPGIKSKIKTKPVVNAQLEESDEEYMEDQTVEIVADQDMDTKSISDNIADNGSNDADDNTDNRNNDADDNTDNRSNDAAVDRRESFMSEEYRGQFNEEMYTHIINILSKMIKIIIAHHKTTLTKFDQIIHRFNIEQEIETENNEDIINRLPLATEEDILEMENFLLQRKNEKNLLQKLEQIGGSTATETTRRVMNNLFTLQLCTKYTLKGKRAHKGNFGELRICKVIEKTVIKKVNSNQAEVQKIIEKWLIRAKDKVTRSETVVARSISNEQ